MGIFNVSIADPVTCLIHLIEAYIDRVRQLAERLFGLENLHTARMRLVNGVYPTKQCY